MAWFDTSEAMGALNAIGRDANNFIKRTIEEIEKDLARVDVNVGAPGLRFGNSRNGASNPGTSDGGGSMGNETKMKKAMACEGCSAKFSVWRRKHSLAWIRWARFNSLGYNSAGLRECLGCKQLFCSQCLPKVVPPNGSGSGGWCSRERRQSTCSKCLILLANPPSRSALLGLKTRDLQAFLASRRVPTHGCLEKDDLVNLIIQLSNYEANGEAHVGVPRGEGTLPSRNASPMSEDSERRSDGDSPPSVVVDEITPSVHTFGSRNEDNSSTAATRASSPSRLSTQSYSHAPPDATTVPCGSSTHNPVLPSAPQTDQMPQSGSHFNVRPHRSNNPSSNDDGDWVMVGLEERPIPPYQEVSLPSTPSTPTPRTPSSPSSLMTEHSLPRRSDVESESLPSRDEVLNPEPTVPSSTGADTSPSLEGGVNSVPEGTPVNPTASNASDREGSEQGSPAARSPFLNRTSSSQGSSPSKGAGSFQMPRDLASSILSSAKSVDDLSTLSVKQLKELLTSSRVDYRGCCEKQELLERAQRLWREYKASMENLSDDTMCKVCMDAAIDCVMLECGHMATCTPCGKRMSECPICRQYVIRIVRTFRA